MKRRMKQVLLIAGFIGMLGSIVGCSASDPQTGTEQGENGSTLVVEEGLHEGAYDGSIKHVGVHDPSIVRAVDEKGEPMYYVFGTHITSAASKNLIHWKVFTNGYSKVNNTLYDNLSENLAEPFQWAGQDDSDCKGGFAVWAPDVIYNDQYVNEDGSTGAYMLYFCTSSTYCRSAIGFAVSDQIDKNYTCKGTLVYSGFNQYGGKDAYSRVDKIWTNTNIDELMAEGRIKEGYSGIWGGADYNTDYAPNAIDPTVFFDAEGRMWMTYGSWSGGIYLLELDPKTGDAIYPGESKKTEDGRVIDKYFGTRIAGGHTRSGEGPYILYDENTEYYYLYTTYNYLDSVSGYNMRLFRSKSPEGPYLDAEGNNAVFEDRNTNQYQIGIKVMGNYKFSNNAIGYRSPGHCSSFIDEDGQMYLVYHTRFDNLGEAFELRVHQQFVNEEGWPVTAVFEYRGDQISEKGYAKENLVGNYEFINHGTGSDGADVRKPQNIVLHADGSISGDVEGKWEQKEGCYYATFEIDEVTYHGIFFEQHDESVKSEIVMTFSAIGDNNETIMGVKQVEK